MCARDAACVKHRSFSQPGSRANPAGGDAIKMRTDWGVMPMSCRDISDEANGAPRVIASSLLFGALHQEQDS